MKKLQVECEKINEFAFTHPVNVNSFKAINLDKKINLEQANDFIDHSDWFWDYIS